MKIAVIGTGYVGLVTGACFSDFGNDVLCVDIDARKIDDPRRAARSRSTSPGLQEMVRRNARAGRLQFTTDIAEASRTARCSSSRSARRPARTAPPICSTCSPPRATSAAT